MAIPKLKKQDVIDALKFIDENGVPEHNTSVKYVLVSEDGKKYPPKYVVAVADHLANSTDISTESFNSVDAKNYLKSLGFSIETKQQEKFELSITAESVESTDERFTMDNLSLGDNYKPLDAYFKRANGDVIKRAYSKGERRNSNQTLPRIACQVFEKQLAALSVEDKENFPVCKYNPGSDVIRGIYASVDDFKNRRNTIEYLTYGYDNGRQFVIYCWNIFSTIIFVQECLKRFGEPGDQFILTYREKDEKETAAAETEAAVQEELPLHTCSHIGELNMRRVRTVPHDGGSRSSFPPDLVLKCHRDYPNGFRDVYGRMHWDQPSPTITGGCTNITRGRYVHPDQDRGISLYEAAKLQTFPDNYVFAGNFGEKSLQIGNAVPVRLAQVMGARLIQCLNEINGQV